MKRSEEPTPSELQVLKLMALGVESVDIATELGTKPATIRKHRANLFLRIQAHSAANAVHIAYQNDWWGHRSPPRTRRTK